MKHSDKSGRDRAGAGIAPHRTAGSSADAGQGGTARRRHPAGRLAALGCACVAATLGLSPRARALEAANPYLNGNNIGIPIAAMPPPGFYANSTSFAKPETVYDGNGNKTPIDSSIYGTTFAAIYVPPFKLLGASYLAFIRQPVVGVIDHAFGQRASNAGFFNTIISPINLGWVIGPGLFVSTGMAFYPPDGTYNRRNAVNIANNFATFEPSAAISYLHNGLNLTAFANYDMNTTNNDSAAGAAYATGHYYSGNTFNLDLSAVQSFGALQVGAGGYLEQQTTNDTASGQVVGASPFNSRGNRASDFALGPTLGYRVGRVDFFAYYLRDVVHTNTIGGNSFFLRIGTRF